MAEVAHLLRAEWLKMRTTRVALALLAVSALLIAGLLCLALATLESDQLAGEDGVRTVLSTGGGLIYFFTLSLGVIGMAGEYRHATMGHTMLAAPGRWPILVSKVIAYLLAGLAFAAVAVALTVAIGVPWMEAKDEPVALDEALPWEIIAGSLAGGALYAVIGVGLAAIMREQVAALMVGIGWSAVIDTFIAPLSDDVAKFFPGQALASLIGANTDGLDAGLAGLLLLGYAAVFVVAGAVLLKRRDL